jgi:hypothetical protein
MDKELTKPNTDLILYSAEFLERVKLIKEDMHKFYISIGEEVTPRLDGSGRQIVALRPDGKEYIIETYMRKKLDEYFPGWTLESAAPLQFLGVEWVVAQVNLIIIDEHLLAFGIIPPIRKFYGVDSVRIQFKKDSQHLAENVIDIGDNCKQAVSAAFKYAINRLTNIGDDIYGKRIDLEGAGTIDTIITSSKTNNVVVISMFNEYCKNKHLRPSEMFKILDIKSIDQITDYRQAYHTLRKYFGEE